MFHDSAHIASSVNIGHQHRSMILDCTHRLVLLRVFFGRFHSCSQGPLRRLRSYPEYTSRDDPMLRDGLKRVSVPDAYQLRVSHR